MSTQPLLSFVIGGVQKAGTSALARYLSMHPQLRLPRNKEAHVFDAPTFVDTASTSDIDAQYAAHFDAPLSPGTAKYGDATPIYLFHPRLIERIAHYNPAMRWIVLLRDPIERALSHYHMERARRTEHWPLWPALLCERWRLRGHDEDLSDGSPLRTFSYRARSDYASQLDCLYRHFPREQVLLLRSAELRSDPAVCLAHACAFLGVESLPQAPTPANVFVGSYRQPGRFSPTRLLLHWLLRAPRRQLQQRYDITFVNTPRRLGCPTRSPTARGLTSAMMTGTEVLGFAWLSPTYMGNGCRWQSTLRGRIPADRARCHAGVRTDPLSSALRTGSNMRVLVSNDDGVEVIGIRVLAQTLRQAGLAVTVVAPDRDRSGASNSLTLDQPIRATAIDAETWRVAGTPTDCVHLALAGLLDVEPDIVISGINNSANLGDDVIYSGTVAAAMEGRFLGLPAIAVSLANGEGPERHFDTAARAVLAVMQRLRTDPLPADTILNLNVPDLPWDQLRGWEVTRLGHRHRAEPCIAQHDPRGRPIWWIGPPGAAQDAGPGTDFHAIRYGAISITPIHVDLTRYQALEKVAGWVLALGEQMAAQR